MTTPTRLRLALALLCVCGFVRPGWAQHGAGAHAGGGSGFHTGAGSSFGGHPASRSSAPSSAPRPLYGSFSSYRGSSAPFAFRGPGHFVRPGGEFQQFRGFSGAAAQAAVSGGRFPRSSYLAGRDPRYSSQPKSRLPSGRSPAGSRGTHLTASNRPPVTSFHGHPPVFPPQAGSFNPFFGNVFVRNTPFFYWPFYYPTFTWWSYPPQTFSNSYAPQGCPYDDYYYQRQPYYQPEEQGGEAEQPAESAEEAANVPPVQPEEQTAPLPYEAPLPDVIEWGKASEAAPEKQPTPAGQGPLVVNLPHHTLTILLNEPSSLGTPAPQPAP
jgi:hypothetical protein